MASAPDLVHADGRSRSQDGPPGDEIAKTFTHIDQATRTTAAFTDMANEERSLDLLLRYETAYSRMSTAP